MIDSALRPGGEPEQWQERELNDGSRHWVYKRYLTAAQLAEELGAEVLLDGAWYVAARASWAGEDVTRQTTSKPFPGRAPAGAHARRARGEP